MWKLRAWDRSHKIMEYIDDMYWFEESGIQEINDDGTAFSRTGDYIFMRSTGMTDCNGRSIYEGDILKSQLDGSYYVVRWDETRCGFISVTTLKDGSEWWIEIDHRDQVVGNIYENPELVKGRDKMKKCFVVLNHRPSEDQLKELRDKFKATEMIELPNELKRIWGQIPPEGSTYPSDHLTPITDWIKKQARTGDILWFQGEVASCMILRNYAREWSLLPLHATSKRESVEVVKPDGSVEKRSIFKHVNFRLYP